MSARQRSCAGPRGFKSYNDNYGHPAGDELLARSRRNLEAVMGTGARTAWEATSSASSRVRPDMGKAFVRRALKALSERGEGFEITASHGVVDDPSEAETPSDALRVADRRMYARKASQRTSPGRQSAAALIELLSQRSPELRPHSANVAELCEAVGRKLDLPLDELVPLLDAAPLHDIGKAAIPDAILNKTSALDEQELSFIRRQHDHRERILRAAPRPRNSCDARALEPRTDGRERLSGRTPRRGDPVGARIIAVCDAYDAMVSERPYGVALSPRDAIAELRRSSRKPVRPECGRGPHGRGGRRAHTIKLLRPSAAV